MPYEVTVKEVPTQPIVSIRSRTSLASIQQTIERGFGDLMAYLGGQGVTLTGPPFLLYHELIDQETDGDVEVCMPVGRVLPGEGEIRGSELPGGSVASTTHRGPYAEIGPAYGALTEWVERKGREFAGPPREVYLNDPGQVDPPGLETEILWPIR